MAEAGGAAELGPRSPCALSWPSQEARSRDRLVCGRGAVTRDRKDQSNPTPTRVMSPAAQYHMLRDGNSWFIAACISESF